jgi:hypothetical protein
MWSNALRVLITAIMASLAFAAPATANTADYLQAVQPWYTNVTAEQLLSEGMRVCSAVRSGMTSPVAVQMVVDDLGVSLTAAGDIVSAAVIHLDCRTR